MRDLIATGIGRCAFALSCLVGFITPARAQTVAPPPSASPAAGADTATLVLRNQRIIVFRSPLGALAPQERAASARERLIRLAERRVADSVVAREIPQGILLSVGESPVLTVTPADVDTLAGQTLEEVVAFAAAQLRVVLAAEIEQRSLIQILRAILLTLIATGLFFLAVRSLVVGRRYVLRKLPHPDAPGLPSFRLRGFTILSAHQLLVFIRRLIELFAWAAGVFVAYIWLAYVLTRFAYSRPYGEILGDWLIAKITELAVGAVTAIPGLFTVVLIVIVTRWITRLISAFFAAVEAGEVDVPWVHPETANPTHRIVSALLWLFAIVVAYPYLPGSDTAAFKGVSVFAGLLITLGSTGIVNQAMSGLVLMYSRALKPGDYVRIGETEGIVTTLGMLSTKIRTNKREEVTLPNAVVVTANIKNYSRLCRDEGVILHTSVTIGYDTPWRQVQGLLLMAAERTTGLRQTPSPFVYQTGLSDFYIEYQLNAYLEHPERRIAVLSELHAHIVDCFNEFGVQITSPHYENDPQAPKVVPRAQWFTPPARALADLPTAPEVQVPVGTDGKGAT